MRNIKEFVTREFEEWTKRESSVVDFEIIPEEPFVKVLKIEEDPGQKKSIKDFMMIFNKKIQVFFEKCETLKTGFINNRKFKNMVTILECQPVGFDLVLHKEKLLFRKNLNLNQKLGIVNSLEFSLILSDHPSTHSLLGWSIEGSRYYYVYEYLSTSLEYYILQDLRSKSLQKLLKSFISGYRFYSKKQIIMNNFQLFIKNDELIFSFPSEIQPSRNAATEAEKLKLIETINKLNIGNWMKVDINPLKSLKIPELLDILDKNSN